MDGGGELLERRGQALIALSVTSTVLAIGTCGVRFMARRQARRGLWWDDYSVMVGMVMGFVAMVFASIQATSTQNPTRAMQASYLGRPWLMLGTTLAKISICFFFLRTLGRRRPWNVFLGMLVLLLAIVNLAFALASNLMCRPLEKLWQPDVDGECFAGETELGIAYFQGGFAVFAFLFLAILPVLLVGDLVLSKSARWPFYVLSISMLLAGVFCVMRTYEVSDIGPRGSFSGAVLLATIFDLLTQNLSIIAANVLPIGTLLISPRDSLSALAPTALSDLESRSIPSSPLLSTKSTIFVIEGPRMDPDYSSPPSYPPSTAHHRLRADEGPSRPGTALSRLTADSRPFTATSLRPDTATVGCSGTEISAGGPLPEGVDIELLRGGIIRTISVDVVEESVDEVEGRKIALGSWKDIISEGPR
ncbi:uncharacterized protein DNG_06648 [Cephalotrichum gorgonifer]|uniref:Rhodopsin domain-containing protein n=1 Tax=Cephalotrichum gorgonifer TaxID=2041049 RepID=A0AAE8N0A5_9PEZI|nr:uncharacterized protein DNG_06648 [Cephalotrichum gorgonifer]